MSASFTVPQSASFTVPRRYCGPPHSANGGWVSGRLARLVPTSTALPVVSVRLLSPPPLDRAMQVHPVADGVHPVADGVLEAVDGVTPVLRAHAVAALATDDVPAPVTYAAAVAAGAAYPGMHDHPFPMCFVCGTARKPGDALLLRPGPVDGREVYAAAWVPTESAQELVWAALDCPGAWALGVGGRPMVLGTMAAQVRELPVVGEEHVVVAWSRGGQGRKHFSGTALYTAEGALLAHAEATWIEIDPAAVRPATAGPA
ncbi:hypothetical protein [Georgenia yuyongxinii]|uniref:Thioesterase superfamily protein n=1 Tax=Georgenia yuyongxinii TaxID=2589797 RepID=A0A552WWE0_9MICO|nr:hypothetical protein [Georgenia yuyongxinii]TRW47087.1 hypothetical protein FJ693_02260 [Georgenia yuyongxinii]